MIPVNIKRTFTNSDANYYMILSNLIPPRHLSNTEFKNYIQFCKLPDLAPSSTQKQLSNPPQTDDHLRPLNKGIGHLQLVFFGKKQLLQTGWNIHKAPPTFL